MSLKVNESLIPQQTKLNPAPKHVVPKHVVPKHGLAHTLTLSYTLSFIALLALLFSALYMSIGALLDKDIDEDLFEDIVEYNQIYQQKGLTRLIEELEGETALGEHDSVFIRLFTLSHAGNLPQLDNTQDKTLNKDKEIYHSSKQNWNDLVFNQSINNDLKRLFNEPYLETQKLSSQEAPTRVIYGVIGDQYLLQMGESSLGKQEIMALLLNGFLSIFSLSVPIAGALIYLQARRSARSIESVSRVAAAIGQGDFSKRASLDANDRETYQLALSFNQMAERVQSLIAEMREMIDNIAHDLRSPLGRIRAIAEMSLTGTQGLPHYQSAAENTLHECDRLLGLINMTLDVAEAEAGVIRASYHELDISAMVIDVCELFEPVAELKHIKMHLNITEHCRFVGSLASLQRMVANLLDNAIKYTPENGNVTVNLLRDKLGIRIAVIDSGVGIPSNQQKRVFERFFRGDQSRTLEGSGLGLSYSKAVARAHGGDIELSSEPHKQTAFTILLPAL